MRAIPDELRNRLLLAAAEEFAVKRFEGASLNRILERAGVSKGRFYYYFTDKAALFGAVLESIFSGFADGLSRLGEAGTPHQFWEAMERLVEEGWRAYAEDPILRSLSHQALEMASQPGHPVQVFLQGLLEQLHKALAAGATLGAVRRDMDLSLLTGLLAAIDTAADRWLMSEPDPKPALNVAELTGHYMDLYKRLLLPRTLLLEHLLEDENRAVDEPSFQVDTKRKKRPAQAEENRTDPDQD